VKLRFEPDLAHQLQAVAAACDLFSGQEMRRGGPGDYALMADDNGVLANHWALSDAQLLHNLRAVQQRNGLEPSAALESRDFTLEMETGTGKTYVYLRTIHELHRRYGFGKFVIVVPSVAIKQGVQQALLGMQDHFRRLYAGVPLEHFVYDSAQPGRLRRFATSAGIQVMVLGVGAINRRALNRVYRHSEQSGGEQPLALIRATRPIVIVDEPQSVDGGPAGAGRRALDALGPLCTLRYSATHAALHHPIYRLDAVDAYERRLVKQIEVASAQATADVQDDADQPTRALQRAMIRRTIHEHLHKELQLAPRGIKVLSLFFVDAVARYRDYDAAGRPLPGPYARIFEEEYRQAAQLPAFGPLFDGLDPAQAAAQVHGGYFSRDRHGRWTEPALDPAGGLRDAASRADAERGWRLILQDKEALLEMTTPLKFIFSHSALKEGWDNPNVFQICVLREMGSERQRRQTLGRGLRLCVDQRGQRVHGFEVNRLTVIAGESYEDYAAGLQQEIDAGAGPPRAAARLPLRNRDAPMLPASQAATKAVPLGDDFLEWWGRAGQGVLDLGLDSERLLQACSDALAGAPSSAATQPHWRKASLALGRDGVALQAAEEGPDAAAEEQAPQPALPDLLTALQQRTRLTRRTLLRLLLEGGRLDAFRRDPQGFIEQTAATLLRCLQQALREGLHPLSLADGLVCAQPLSAQHGPGASLADRLMEAARSGQGSTGFESPAEHTLAQALERHAEMLHYARLPAGFGISTPLGAYRPDWVLLLQRGGVRQLGFLPAAPAGAACLVPADFSPICCG